MEPLSSRILLRPSDPAKSQAFYRDVLGLAVYREFGDPESPGIVFFLDDLDVLGLQPVEDGAVADNGDAVEYHLLELRRRT